MQQSFDYIRQSLASLYTQREATQLAIIILQNITGLSKANILTNKYTILSEIQNEKVRLIVERLKKNEPLEYILGETSFFDLSFNVNPFTLIPRPETEELVDWIIRDHTNQQSLRILDIGTGSGCIAVSLAKNLPGSHVTAFDISIEALHTAKKNAENNRVKVDFVEQDILKVTENNGLQFDIIVSNPPYICEKEKTGMEDNVLKYEPHTALFVPDNDPLQFYRAIGSFAISHLSPTGCLYVEINRAFGDEVCKMFEETGFSTVELRKDLYGNNRMIKASR